MHRGLRFHFDNDDDAPSETRESPPPAPWLSWFQQAERKPLWLLSLSDCGANSGAWSPSFLNATLFLLLHRLCRSPNLEDYLLHLPLTKGLDSLTPLR